MGVDFCVGRAFEYGEFRFLLSGYIEAEKTANEWKIS